MTEMKWSWWIFLSVLVVNTVYMVTIYFTQYTGRALPVQGSMIPDTNQKFLYAQDFYVMTWGDLLGLMLIINGFMHLVFEDHRNLLWGLGIGFTVGLIFVFLWLGKNHKPDYSVPYVGEMSFSGILHSIYFAFGVGASSVCLWKWRFFLGDFRGPVMWVALVGAVIYLSVRQLDVWAGHFEPLKKIQGLSKS